MKKICLSFLAALICATVLVGCGRPKTAISSAEFSEKAQQAGMTVQDATDQFAESTVESVYIAVGNGYQIEFYVVATEQQAIAAYNESKRNFEAVQGNSASTTESNIHNYSKYTQTSAGMYSVASRVENTFIYVNTDAGHKSEVNDFLKAIGY